MVHASHQFFMLVCRPSLINDGKSALCATQLTRQEGESPGSSDWTLQSDALRFAITPATVTALRALQRIWANGAAQCNVPAVTGGLTHTDRMPRKDQHAPPAVEQMLHVVMSASSAFLAV